MIKRCHVAAHVHATWRCMCVCAFACVRSHVCVRMCARVFARVISGLKHPLRIFANPLDAYTLYYRQISKFMSCGTIYLYF